MPNEKHVERLKDGVEKWNRWRKDTKEVPDLNQANLRAANLSAANLHEAYLRRPEIAGRWEGPNKGRGAWSIR